MAKELCVDNYELHEYIKILSAVIKIYTRRSGHRHIQWMILNPSMSLTRIQEFYYSYMPAVYIRKTSILKKQYTFEIHKINAFKTK